MPFFPIPNLWGFDLKKIQKLPKNGYLSFGESLFFFLPRQFSTFFLNLFFFFSFQIYSILMEDDPYIELFSRKNHFFGFWGYFDMKIPTFFKNSIFDPQKNFLVNLFFLKTTYTYVKICQEQAGDSGFSRKNRFRGQNGQKYVNFGKILKK